MDCPLFEWKLCHRISNTETVRPSSPFSPLIWSRHVDGIWHSLTSTCSTSFTDTIPILNPENGQINATSTYRVRASNDYGWSPYSEPFDVNLIDKISTATAPSRWPLRQRSERVSSLLPHGITVSTHREGRDEDESPSGASPSQSQSQSRSRLLSSAERDTLVYSNMYSLPPPESRHLHDEPPHVLGSSSRPTLPQSGEHGLLDYGKNPTRHPDSTLAGETLTNVNKSLEHWLCRLADTCPIDETIRTTTTNHRQSQRKDDTEAAQESGGEGETEEIADSERKGKKKKSERQVKISSQQSVLESIYQSSAITDKYTPLSRAKKENLIQQLVVSNHRTKTIKEPTQPIGTSTFPNRIFVPK
jgi:hypothetical protein